MSAIKYIIVTFSKAWLLYVVWCRGIKLSFVRLIKWPYRWVGHRSVSEWKHSLKPRFVAQTAVQPSATYEHPTHTRCFHQDLKSGLWKCVQGMAGLLKFIKKYLKNNTIFFKKWASTGCLDTCSPSWSLNNSNNKSTSVCWIWDGRQPVRCIVPSWL